MSEDVPSGCNILRIDSGCKPNQPFIIEKDTQRVNAGQEYIQTQGELGLVDQKRFRDIPGKRKYAFQKLVKILTFVLSEVLSLGSDSICLSP